MHDKPFAVVVVPIVYDTFTEPGMSFDPWLSLTCTCPNCNEGFPFKGNYRRVSHNSMFNRSMGEAQCPHCKAAAYVDISDLDTALEGPLEKLPLIMNSPNALARDIVKLRLEKSKRQSAKYLDISVRLTSGDTE